MWGYSSTEVLPAFSVAIAKASVAALDQHGVLALAAVEETGRGVFEDKATKNLFACEYIVNNMRHLKTVGIISENEVTGITKIAEPIGVIAGITPVTNGGNRFIDCRFQLASDTYYCAMFERMRGLQFVNTIVDENEGIGILFKDCEYVDLTNTMGWNNGKLNSPQFTLQFENCRSILDYVADPSNF